MALSHKQGLIVAFMRGKESVTKKEITEKYGFWYYTNEAFHIGALLSNMVKRGILIRIKKGVFKIGKNSGNTDLSLNNPNQTDLFP